MSYTSFSSSKTTVAIFIAFIASIFSSKAQNYTDIQIQYDFGADRQLITTTVEGFYNDKWGNTFFFIDHDFPLQCSPNYIGVSNADRAIGLTYWEIARCLNFWHETKADFFSVHVEYDGGFGRNPSGNPESPGSYGINHAFLFGGDFFVHSKDYKNTFNFKLMYKHILYDNPNDIATVPLQFTFVWNMHDLGGVKGLQFTGFADFWGEKHPVWVPMDNEWHISHDPTSSIQSQFIFLSEPQIWYSVGQWFKCPNLNVGGEVELSYDFSGVHGFHARPCLGVKWVF